MDISSDISLENKGVCGSPFVTSVDSPVTILLEDLEVEGQTGLCNLLKAYEEAMEMGNEELAKVIMRCINEKASPLGGTMERVAFYWFQSGNQVDYIKQESMKNFQQAFKTFYACFPYGRFAHFAANSAILEAIMSDSRKVHILDFDIGEGVQWPSMLEAIGKLKGEMKLTSIRTNTQSYSFEETKNRLLDYANGCGLKLEVLNISIEELVWKIERSCEHEFLAFNCMVGLPHMGRQEIARGEVMQFVRDAKKLLLTNKGIITFGDGEDFLRTNVCRRFGSFFDDYITHYHALCESMERSFPETLTEARLAMESLFVGPNVSSLCWYQNWKNKRREYVFIEDIGLMGWRLSRESLMEAKDMVKERESSYNIRVEGQNNNEMVLEWKGTPLVRVSAWR
ncbi:protein NODULATION SIGNALING PATHWAY 2-like [Bidens hawaiensis]|uniref:protein NODULATION SIGNALING PATHWAY 2-like n=1 Tax=Bidens hawaiensis TaxID=980011 RepID=UPI00404B880D